MRRRPRCLTIYCRDITCLPTQLRGAYFYLYLFVDIFSRKIVGRQVFDCERAQRAAQLLQDICLRLGIRPGQLTVHSDNGGPMKGATMPATMQRLGVAQTRSRPAVSNDNPCSESRFKTLKYRPPAWIERCSGRAPKSANRRANQTRCDGPSRPAIGNPSTLFTSTPTPLSTRSPINSKTQPD